MINAVVPKAGRQCGAPAT